jgi:hypothetical protein
MHSPALTISFFKQAAPLPCTGNKKIRTDPGVGALTTSNSSSSKPERQRTNTDERSSRHTDERSSLATQQHAAISQHKRTQQSQQNNNQQYLPTDDCLTRCQELHRAVPPCQCHRAKPNVPITTLCTKFCQVDWCYVAQ